MFVFTKTWLSDNIPDSTIQLHGLTCCRAGEVLTVLSAAGVHGHCYCRCVHSPMCKAKDALRELYSAISEQQTNNPDGFFIIAGDFNHANLKTVLPKFYQHVNFATRRNNTLDIVYTTVKNAYKAEPHPHHGYFDHISVMLFPVYRPLLKLSKPVQKQITLWLDNATWSMFKEAASLCTLV